MGASGLVLVAVWSRIQGCFEPVDWLCNRCVFASAGGAMELGHLVVALRLGAIVF